MRWFKHMTDASFNCKITAVEDELGLLGSGMFWRIMEVVGAQLDEKRRTFVEHSAKTWGNFCRLSAKKFTKYVGILEKNELILIKKNQNSITIDIPNILEYMDEHTRRRLRETGVTPESLLSNSGPDTDTDTEEEREEEEKTPSISPPGESECVEPPKLEILSDGLPKLPDDLPAKISEAYERILVPAGWPRFGGWYDKLIRQVRICIGEKPSRVSPGFWEKHFNRIRGSDFPNSREFGSRSIVWATKPETVGKIENGMWQSGKPKQTSLKDDWNFLNGLDGEQENRPDG